MTLLVERSGERMAAGGGVTEHDLYLLFDVVVPQNPAAGPGSR